MTTNDYLVTLRFDFPAYDEVDGIEFRINGVRSKREAIRCARKQAEYDGHVPVRMKGQYWFKAVVIEK